METLMMVYLCMMNTFAYYLCNGFYSFGLLLNNGRSTFEAAANEESKPKILLGSMAEREE